MFTAAFYTLFVAVTILLFVIPITTAMDMGECNHRPILYALASWSI
jgi:hypothetical protein